MMYRDGSNRIMTPLSIGGIEVYRIGEALKTARVSRPTFFRWVKSGRIDDTKYRDRNGRRVFTKEELQQLADKADRLIESSALPSSSSGKTNEE
jgi:hypothetical protein